MIEIPRDSYTRFPDYVQGAYGDVLHWLSSRPEAAGFARLDHNTVCGMLSERTLLSAAGQFCDLLPAHYFKVVHVLRETLGLETLMRWLSKNPHFCFIDVGCGGGTASAGFIEIAFDLQAGLGYPIHVVCLGLDVNPYALAVYDAFLSAVERRLDTSLLTVEHIVFARGIPDVVLPMIRCLRSMRERWQQPSIPHVMVAQVNVVSQLTREHEMRCGQQEILERLGVPGDRIADRGAEFGEAEAMAYKQLLEEVPVDNLHVVTVGTEHHLWEQRVREMAASTERAFGSGGHAVDRLAQGKFSVYFENPIGSSWRTNRGRFYSTSFYADISSIKSQFWLQDREWQAVVDITNLRLAWARARKHFLENSVLDEIEVRMFEHHLERNLTRLQEQLLAYAQDVARTDDRIAYRSPKTATTARPRGLSRMEEEILSVAVIQKLGNKADSLRGMSYAYRLAAGSETEYLYADWFGGYFGEFLGRARADAGRSPGCVVLMTDVESFFERIVQDRLLDLVSVELTQSDRVRWLLRLLLRRDVDQHEAGLGLVQGNIGSGYYANLYLTSVDTAFGANNPWLVKFHRYSDDMIFIIPDPQDLQGVLDKLDDKLGSLDLRRSKKKTEIYMDASEFLRLTEPDVLLDALQTRHMEITTALWVGTEEYRGEFRRHFDSDDAWWFHIRVYRECFASIGMHISTTDLSRRICKYLFDQQRRDKDLDGRGELALPDFPTTWTVGAALRWARSFQERNAEWIESANALRADLASLCRDSWRALKASDGTDPASERSLRRRIRFAVTKLQLLGLSPVGTDLLDILIHDPSTIRQPGPLLDALVQQGFSHEIVELLGQYPDSEEPIAQYMRAVVLRALRWLQIMEREYWEVLASSALTGSMVERLMATETWLHLGHRFPGAPTVDYADDFKAALAEARSSESWRDSRVARNYALIVGQNDPDPLQQTQGRGESWINSVREIIATGDAAILFRDEEPGTIRRAYYSGRRPVEMGVEEGYV